MAYHYKKQLSDKLIHTIYFDGYLVGTDEAGLHPDHEDTMDAVNSYLDDESTLQEIAAEAWIEVHGADYGPGPIKAIMEMPPEELLIQCTFVPVEFMNCEVDNIATENDVLFLLEKFFHRTFAELFKRHPFTNEKISESCESKRKRVDWLKTLRSA